MHRAKTHKEDVLSICGPRRQSGMPSTYAPVLYTVGFLEVLFHLHTHTKTSFSNYFEQKKYNLKPNLHFSQFNANHFLSDDTLSTAHEIIKKQS